MQQLTITGVPEHFNFPWKKVVESQPFLNQGIHLQWIDEPKGSGAMNNAIMEARTDLAIVLTESFVKDKIEGNPGLMIGLHVSSPLIWGIHVPANSAIGSIDELEEAEFLISRFGSGSHLMAFVLAQREGWDTSRLRFEVVGDLNGAVEKSKTGKSSIFLWEKFTTKPLVDAGVFRRIGEIPTPWPCFAIIAHPDSIQKFGNIATKLRDLVYEKANALRSDIKLVSDLSIAYGILPKDVETWLVQTTWAKQPTIRESIIENIQTTLLELGLIDKKLNAAEFMMPTLSGRIAE